MTQPNYPELVRFLIAPFLEAPDSLAIDCEVYGPAQKVWIRVAFPSSDKGRVFGRGGRTLQAIRKVVGVAGQVAGQTVALEVHGERGEREGSSRGGSRDRRPRTRRPSRS